MNSPFLPVFLLYMYGCMYVMCVYMLCMYDIYQPPVGITKLYNKTTLKSYILICLELNIT